MIIGYARVSKPEQNLERQMDQLHAYGCEKVFSEKVSSRLKERPEFERMLDQIREGDTIIISELSRASRSVRELLTLVDLLKSKGANIKSLKESWIDTTTPQGQLMFTIFAGLAEFEREQTRQRVMEGLTAARARGRNGGRPSVDNKKVEMALKMYDSKNHSISDITAASGISKQTLYKYLNKRE